MPRSRLTVLHPGAMGAAVAACLVGRGHEVGYLHIGRSEATLRRAEQSGLTRREQEIAATSPRARPTSTSRAAAV